MKTLTDKKLLTSPWQFVAAREMHDMVCALYSCQSATIVFFDQSEASFTNGAWQLAHVPEGLVSIPEADDFCDSISVNAEECALIN